MRSSEGPLLAAEGLERSFGRLRALDGVDLALEAGEVLVVAGPNGAGKTTLLRVLAGLARPSRGAVRVGGRTVRSADPASRRAIGFVAHESHLYDDLTLAENVAFAARLHGLDAPARRAQEVLAAAGLSERSAQTPRQLSRGLVQRAAIARALVHEPALLLLDEPFTGLDAASATTFRALLAGHAARGGAAVVVTHQPAEAWDVATHAAILRAGRWAHRAPRQGEAAAFLARATEPAG